MRRNTILKKIRKATRRNRVESFEYFWQEIRETGFWMRLRICLEIMKKPYEKRTLQIREVRKTKGAINDKSEHTVDAGTDRGHKESSFSHNAETK